jgi:hypothetical protein
MGMWDPWSCCTAPYANRTTLSTHRKDESSKNGHDPYDLVDMVQKGQTIKHWKDGHGLTVSENEGQKA